MCFLFLFLFFLGWGFVCLFFCDQGPVQHSYKRFHGGYYSPASWFASQWNWHCGALNTQAVTCPPPPVAMDTRGLGPADGSHGGGGSVQALNQEYNDIVMSKNVNSCWYNISLATISLDLWMVIAVSLRWRWGQFLLWGFWGAGNHTVKSTRETRLYECMHTPPCTTETELLHYVLNKKLKCTDMKKIRLPPTTTTTHWASI